MFNWKRITALLLAVCLLGSLIACSSVPETKKFIIYDGQFSEMQIMHRMVKLLLEEYTDLEVEIKDEMAPVNLYNELKKGTSDLMNSYDGTLLTTYLHLDPSDVPEDMSLYDFANQEGEAEEVMLLGKLGINNTYALGVSQEFSKEKGIEKISDLIPLADQLVFAAEHDFFTEEGSAKYNPLVAFYGLDFKEARQIDLSLKYSAFENGDIDVMVVYATDGLNRKARLKILEDDQEFFPEYNGALLVRTGLFEKYAKAAPDLADILDRLAGILTNEDMVKLTYAVDVEDMSVTDVSRDFLVAKGLLPAS